MFLAVIGHREPTPMNNLQLPSPRIGVMRGVFHEITEADDAFLSIIGYERADLTNGAFYWPALTPDEWIAVDQAGMRQAADTGRFTAPYEKEFIRKDGSRVAVLLLCAFDAGREGGWMGYVVELAPTTVTPGGTPPIGDAVPPTVVEGDYLPLIRELLRERARYVAMLSGAPVFMWAIDREHRLLSANEALQRIQSSVSGQWLAIGDRMLSPALYPPSMLARYREWYTRALAGETFSVVREVNEGDASGWRELHFSPMRDRAGTIQGCTVVGFDATARRRAELQLAERESQFRWIAESLPTGLFLAGPDGELRFANSAFREIFRDSHTQYMNWLDQLAPEDATAMRRVLAGEDAPPALVVRRVAATPPQMLKFRFDHAPGDARAFGVVGVVEDETARAALADQQAQRDKLESLGTLAGGIAHDFNNLLTVILGLAEEASEPDATPEFKASALASIRTTSVRAQELVRQILLFSRRSEHVYVELDIVELARESGRLLRAFTPSTIGLDVQLPQRPMVVRGEAAALQQILVNLVANAVHVLRDQPNGRIQIAVEAVGATFVRLMVSDNGPGVPPSVRARMFEPFFTTKPAGEGTGMGLAVVHGVVAAHEGTIVVDDAPGGGARFTVTLPIVGSSTASRAGAVAESRRSSPPPRVTPASTRTVLIVEDVPQIAELIERALQRESFATRVAAATDLATRVVADGELPIDLVITDLTLPGGSGVDLARWLSTARPQLPCILMSGHLGDTTLQDIGGNVAPRRLLQKPFTTRELLAAVEELL